MITAEKPGRIRADEVRTPRLRQHVLFSGDGDGPVVVFMHGNLSTARFFEQDLAALPDGYRGIAADLAELLASPGAGGVDRVHLVGWSLGGGVAMQYAIDHPASVASVTLLASMSPAGFGGTRDAAGTLCHEDAAGSGAGGVAPGLIEALTAGDSGEENSFAPRPTLRSLYLKPPFRLPPDREDLLVAEILLTALGNDNYPGDSRPSPHWPGVAPGTRGVNNSISPLYCDLSQFAEVATRIPVLWVRGDSDAIVSDESMVDFGQLGKIGAVPGWPRDEYPPQARRPRWRRRLPRCRAASGGRWRGQGGVVEQRVAHGVELPFPAAG